MRQVVEPIVSSILFHTSVTSLENRHALEFRYAHPGEDESNIRRGQSACASQG
jgi:hypothetical protein